MFITEKIWNITKRLNRVEWIVFEDNPGKLQNEHEINISHSMHKFNEPEKLTDMTRIIYI